MTREIRTALILLILHTSTAKPDKGTGPAVFEVINEQARIDDKRFIPYENPLAGKSIQNAKLHAQHQQAMFNAERVRQHRAQILRWNNQLPKQQGDSYMKAYQESQENHHHALEQLQKNGKEKKNRARSEQANLKDKSQIDSDKITTTDSGNKKRNHRSFGSVHNSNQMKRTYVHIYPGTTYDQGVTIKPNGNIQLSNYAKENTELYTSVIPSATHIHPKLYIQPMYAYESAKDISSLSSLLSQSPQEQLTELNTLTHTPTETVPGILDTQNNLYVYLDEPQLANEGAVTSYTESAVADVEKYILHKDYKPITEEFDDVQDDRDHRIQFIQSTIPTILAETDSHTKIANEIVPSKIEYASDIPSYKPLKYENPLKFYLDKPAEGVKYLKSQPTVLQHINQDGTGVSAYEEDNIQYAAKYQFGYRVRDHESGNDFGHHEAKSGENTRGQYHVLLPDGRMQQVKYSAGPEGYHADISYDHLQTQLKH